MGVGVDQARQRVEAGEIVQRRAARRRGTAPTGGGDAAILDQDVAVGRDRLALRIDQVDADIEVPAAADRPAPVSRRKGR